MTNIRLYLTNRRAVSIYKLRKFFGKCKWGVDCEQEKVKDAGYPSQRPPLNPRQINETKTFMTLNYIAKLVFNSRLHNIKQTTERKSCQEPAAMSNPIEPSLSTASIFCLSKACRYFPVVPMSLCPMRAETVLIFAPVSSILTAKE